MENKTINGELNMFHKAPIIVQAYSLNFNNGAIYSPFIVRHQTKTRESKKVRKERKDSEFIESPHMFRLSQEATSRDWKRTTPHHEPRTTFTAETEGWNNPELRNIPRLSDRIAVLSVLLTVASPLG